MTTKQMMFASMIFITTNSFLLIPAECPVAQEASSSKIDFVFYKGIVTRIDGNDLWTYLNFERHQENPTTVFKDTKVVEFTKDKEFQEVGTFGSLEKANRDRTREVISIKSMGSARGFTKSHKVPNKPEVVAKFEKHVTMNNAIYCHDVEQVVDYDGNLHRIGAIIYRTQNLERCSFYREYVAQQKKTLRK